MNTLLVTGGRGKVASALAAEAASFADAGWLLHRVGRPEFDLDRPETIARCVDAAAPGLVVNAAAWTAVDEAEAEPAAAARANADGPERIARCCAAAGIPLIHISTDYVFDGEKGAPYLETDPTRPLNVYGATKLEGERRVLAAGGAAIILRTSWLYAASGPSFVATMLAAAMRRPELRIVADQRGCPTSADDLAAAILAIARQLAGGWRPDHGGVFHTAGSGDASWLDFAEAIFAAAARGGRKVPRLVPIRSAEWPAPARRPADTRLDCGKLASVFGIRLPQWRDSVARTVATICAAEPA